MYLIRTMTGTARLMTNDQIDMEDLNIGIFKTYPFLTKDQMDDLYYGYKTKLISSQIEDIQGLV